MKYRQGVLAGLLLWNATSVYATATQPTLGDHPWPKDAAGKFIEGTTWLELKLDYRGTALAACVLKGSGNDVLDEEAMSRVQHAAAKPFMSEGVPEGGYMIVHENISVGTEPAQQKAVDMIDASRTWSCEPRRFAGIKDAQVRDELVITPKNWASSIDGYSASEWPRTTNGQLLQLDMQTSLLIGKDGAVRDVQLPPTPHDEFFARVAYARLSSLRHPPVTKEHREAITVRFQAEDGAPMITESLEGQSPDMPMTEGSILDQHAFLTPEIAATPAQYVTIIQHDGGALPSGQPWPRYQGRGVPSSFNNHFIPFQTEIGVYVNASGKAQKIQPTFPPRPEFMQELIFLASHRIFTASHGDHWERLVVRFVPTDA